jgi:hypothetical protein
VAQGDSAGYCTDLATFGGNDELQKQLYRSGCTKRDSVPFASTGLAPSRFPGATEALTYTYRHEGRTVYKLYNAQKEHLVSFFVLAGDTAFGYCDTLPSFPGGEKALYSFLGTHTKYPAQAMDNDRSGTVYVRFRVGTDGAIARMAPSVTSTCSRAPTMPWTMRPCAWWAPCPPGTPASGKGVPYRWCTTCPFASRCADPPDLAQAPTRSPFAPLGL